MLLSLRAVAPCLMGGLGCLIHLPYWQPHLLAIAENYTLSFNEYFIFVYPGWGAYQYLFLFSSFSHIHRLSYIGSFPFE
jgi:hypothetical protein